MTSHAPHGASDAPVDPVSRALKRLVPDREAIAGDFPQGFDFFASVAAGLLLGLGLDWWLGTPPVFVIVGVVAGFVSGFVKLWSASRILEERSVHRTAWAPRPDTGAATHTRTEEGEGGAR